MVVPALLSASCVVPVGKVTASLIAWSFKRELRVTAIVKATFAFAEDAAMPRAEPQPIWREEVHHRRSPTQSIRFTTDLVPYRKRADVLFTGDAHAPHGNPVESMRVRLALSDGARSLVDKALLVRKSGGFSRMPLVYERAFGGLGFPENPFGEGFLEEEPEDGPNVIDPADPKRVAGFAPIAEALISRKRLLGTSPIPSFGPHVTQLRDDFDFDFFQAAPADQRVDFLRGDEWILLEGLHPASPRLRTRLPGARGLARIHGLAGFGMRDGAPLAMNADMLHLSGDEQRCTVAWRGSFALASEAALASLRIVAGVESPGEPVAWPDPAALPRPAAAAPKAAAGSAPTSHDTLPLSDSDIEVFSGSEVAGPSGAAAAAGAAPEDPALAATAVLSERSTEPRPVQITEAERPAPPPAGAAPRDAATPRPQAAPSGRRPARGAADETLPVPSRGARPPASLPFVPAPAGSPPPVQRAVPEARPAARHGASGETLPVPSRPAKPAAPALPFQQELAGAPPEPPPQEPPLAVPAKAAATEAPAEAPPEAPPPAPHAPRSPSPSPEKQAAASRSPWAEPPPEPPRSPPKPDAAKPPPNIQGKLYRFYKKG